MVINFDVLHILYGMADEDITDSLTDERVATTLDQMLPVIYNQVVLGNPIFNMLETNKYKEEFTGGARIRTPIRYGKYSNVKSFGKGEVRTPSQPQLLGFAYWNVKQVAGEWAVDWVEEKENSGSEAIIDLVTQRVQALIEDAREAFNTMFWQSSIGNDGKDLNGIPFLIPTDPRSGIMAGFDRSTRYWWRNWYWDNSSLSYGRHPIDSSAGAPANVGSFGSITNKYSTALKLMGTMINSIAMNEQLSDYILLTDQVTYEQYCEIPQYLPSFTIAYSQDDNIVKWNFGGAQFRGIPILFDTVQNGAESGVIRAINLKYLKLRTDSTAWFTWSSERVPYNQFARVRYLMFRGQLVNLLPHKHGVLQGITAWA